MTSDTPKPVENGGFLIDPDTGEVLGLAGIDQFKVTDAESAEWVLEKILQAESDTSPVNACQGTE